MSVSVAKAQFQGVLSDVTGDRALGTVYTNTTGRALWLSVVLQSAGDEALLIINGSLQPFITGTLAPEHTTVTGWIAAGATYEVAVTGGSTLQTWVEGS